MRRRVAVLAAVLMAACSKPAPTPNDEVILADRPAAQLSDYGLFADARGRVAADGVVKYDLVNPLFSDHTDKHRFVYVPTGESAAYRDKDVFAFPVGSVLVKTFAYGERYLETRLLIHKTDGWEAIPYVWNDDGTEATYSPIGKRIGIKAEEAGEGIEAFTYAVPNKNQCKTCHQSGDALTPIGPRARNLNHVGPHGVNQITDWSDRDLLIGAAETPPSVPFAGDVTADLNARARAYLDINCAHCHKADGSASNSGLWLDWHEDSAVRLGVGKHPTAAGRGAGEFAYVIEPGAPEDSIMTYRMASGEAGVGMPELGRATIDEEGVDLIRAWIRDLPAERS
ncbi:MAG: SO2930 family diheme c-type cytochrome [Henriciella sp.]|nr:SO2930 family diheme c-type cytochrome [Henriciella sp.]